LVVGKAVQNKKTSFHSLLGVLGVKGLRSSNNEREGIELKREAVFASRFLLSS
jgi:hypothetical protein